MYQESETGKRGNKAQVPCQVHDSEFKIPSSREDGTKARQQSRKEGTPVGIDAVSPIVPKPRVADVEVGETVRIKEAEVAYTLQGAKNKEQQNRDTLDRLLERVCSESQATGTSNQLGSS